MKSFKQAIRTASFIFVSFLLAIGYPLSIAVADDTPTTDTTTTTTPSPDSSTSSTAPDSATTTTATPTTTTTESTPTTTSTETQPTTTDSSSTTTEPQKTYTYDSSTGRWNSDAWTYDATSGTYQPTVIPQPTTSTTTSPTLAQTGLTDSTASAIGNALNSVATSGDASILSNTLGGSATTGDATSVATVLNNVNSTLTNTNNTQAANFVSNVMGDVNGDIMLQPMLLKAMLEAAASQQATTDSTINSTTNTNATNDITLNANSGDATVSSNTSAGNATTGNANTVANVINLINSMVAANQSFVGTINIYGNLNGDILIAPDFIPQLLASNGGSTAPAVAGTASITSNDNQSVVNNIALAAKTGEALVSGNTTAGSATTGDATTNTVIFNLTNHAIVASNSLLVFVNVLGRWVGVIVDAPTGATAAAIGSGVVSDTVSPNLVIDATNNTALTNNINLTSQSGNATVTNNTSAGNATTGNATASANVANITGSQMGLSGWFGVLFINVFGSWLGSFGINTDAGNPLVPATKPPTSSSGPVPEVIKFIPHSVRQAPATIVQGGAVMTTPPAEQAPAESNAQDTNGSVAKTGNTDSSTPTYGNAPIDALNLPMLLGSLVLVGGSLFGLRRLA